MEKACEEWRPPTFLIQKKKKFCNKMGSVVVQALGQGCGPSTPDFRPVSLRVGDKEWPWEACIQASSRVLRGLIRRGFSRRFSLHFLSFSFFSF